MDYINVNDFQYQPSPRGVGEEFLLRMGDLRTKLLRYKAGEMVPLHTHTDEKHEKLIVVGKGEFKDESGEKAILGPGLCTCVAAGQLTTAVFF